jgi:hypothetical protein
MIGRRQVMSGTPPWHYMWLLRHTGDNFLTELVAPLDTSEKYPRIATRPDEEGRSSRGFPSASDPETEADRTPRESLLACMTVNR